MADFVVSGYWSKDGEVKPKDINYNLKSTCLEKFRILK